MKIVLAASKREETLELGLMAIGSYAHMICRRSEASAIFFPLTYFAVMDSVALEAIKKISRISQTVIGVGYQENEAYVYALFDRDDVRYFHGDGVHSFSLSGRTFRLSMGEIPEEGTTPLIYLHDRKEEVDPLMCKGSYELYDLGPCTDERYEAIVFQNQKIKCRLLPERPSFLLKSVPDESDL